MCMQNLCHTHIYTHAYTHIYIRKEAYLVPKSNESTKYNKLEFAIVYQIFLIPFQNSFSNNDLVYIDMTMIELTCHQKILYEDQCTERECRLSEEIDFNFKEEQHQKKQEQSKKWCRLNS